MIKSNFKKTNFKSYLDQRFFTLYTPNQKYSRCEWLESSIASCLSIVSKEGLKEYEIVESFTLIHVEEEED